MSLGEFWGTTGSVGGGAAMASAAIAWLAGPAFDEFVEREFASLRATMVKAGMV